jgi:hypothetical protein
MEKTERFMLAKYISLPFEFKWKRSMKNLVCKSLEAWWKHQTPFFIISETLLCFFFLSLFPHSALVSLPVGCEQFSDIFYASLLLMFMIIFFARVSFQAMENFNRLNVHPKKKTVL